MIKTTRKKHEEIETTRKKHGEIKVGKNEGITSVRQTNRDR